MGRNDGISLSIDVVAGRDARRSSGNPDYRPLVGYRSENIVLQYSYAANMLQRTP